MRDNIFLSIMMEMVKNKGSAVGLGIIVLFSLAGLFGAYMAPHDPLEMDLGNILQTPSLSHLLGTDEIGRDILSRILVGAKYSLSLVVFATGIGGMIGIYIGTIAGFYGGKIESILMGCIDVLLAFPGIIIAIMILSIVGINLMGLILALGISSVPRFARVSRSAVLMVKENEYVEAARLIGESDLNIIFRYVLPNACGPIFVDISLRAAQILLLGAGLSFLGLGVQPPAPEWGNLIATSRNYLQDASHILLFPGLAIYAVATAFNLIGDGLRDALDPRIKKEILKET